MMGPVDYIIVGFKGNNFDGNMLNEITNAANLGIIRVLDLLFVIKDEKGNTLKKWTFANATGSDLSMAISVKELLQLEKNNAHHDLSIHYTARELPKGETLAFLRHK